MGSTSAISEPFTWDVTNARIRLGTGHYVGMMDDISAFNQSLSDEEVTALYNLSNGVAELYR
jgi:hypothetical protein